MKPALLFLLSSVLLTSCAKVTLENRRDLYCREKVNGPYTRMLRDGIPTAVVVQEVTVTETSSYKTTVAPSR